MWNPGSPSSIVRWLCHIPTGAVAVLSISNYYLLVDVPTDVLDTGENGHALVTGTQLNGIVGTIVFIWNLFQFLASPRGVPLWLTGFIDLLSAFLLTIGCALVGTFLPGSLGGCSSASTWKNSPDGRNLFIELSDNSPDGADDFEELAGTAATAMCKGFVLTWILTLVAVVVCYVLGILNMAIGYQTVFYGSERTWPSTNVFKPVVFAVKYLVGAGIFASRLARRSYHRTRLCLARVSSPSIGHVWSRIWTTARAPSTPHGYELLPAANREAVKSLPPEIVFIIAEYAHFDDLISLSQSSWALRTMFFGEIDPLARLRAIEKVSCPGEKSTCTVCHTRICSSCTVGDTKIGISIPLRHLDGCQPHCSSCYWDLRCNPTKKKKGFETHRHFRFFCHVVAGYGSILALLPDLDAPLQSPNPPSPPKGTCRRCSALALPDRRSLMEAKDEEVAKQVWRGNLECKVCCTLLGKTALRWWVCLRCGGDCPDGMHPLTGF